MGQQVTAILIGHYGDKPRDTELVLVQAGKTEDELVRIIAEVYMLDDEEEITTPNLLTWDWLAEKLGADVWWDVQHRTVED